MAGMCAKFVVLGLVISACCARVNAQQQEQPSPPPPTMIQGPLLPPCWIFSLGDPQRNVCISADHPPPSAVACAGGGTTGGSYKVGGAISAPKPIYTPDPEFSDEARDAKYQGTVVLRTMIGTDGLPRDIRIHRSLGKGLDEKAVEALRRWRFAPALKDGQPVRVEITVEVRFKLQRTGTDCTL